MFYEKFRKSRGHFGKRLMHKYLLDLEPRVFHGLGEIHDTLEDGAPSCL